MTIPARAGMTAVVAKPNAIAPTAIHRVDAEPHDREVQDALNRVRMAVQNGAALRSTTMTQRHRGTGGDRHHNAPSL